MFYRTLFHRTLAFHLTTATAFRSFSSSSALAMATPAPTQNFALDRSIWNPSLYSRMRDFWFADLPQGARVPQFETAKKWFGVGMSQEQKDAFDQECRDHFGAAIESIGPERLALPEWEGYEKDIEEADTISSPFLKEVEDAQVENEKKGADTLLALLLLLDQMPRNMYRDPAGLRLVFGHYDRLAHALLQSSMRLSPNPIEDESFRLKPVYQSWFLLPLMHAEHMPAHDLSRNITQRWRERGVHADDQAVVEALDDSLKYVDSHDEPLRRFGRYPHRNECLGRGNTEKEEEFLRGGGETFGVKQGGGRGVKEEVGKSEL